MQAIIASPYVRAQQTAALVHDTLGFAEPVRTVAWLTPDSDVQQVIGEIERLGLEHVLLVSHQPLVGTLVGALEHGHQQQQSAGMSTASLAELEGDWPLAGLMTLRALNSPA
ncbi:Phosphohistidine phosphatase SixA [compost metagenome]